jgi:hypothetical protein
VALPAILPTLVSETDDTTSLRIFFSYSVEKSRGVGALLPFSKSMAYLRLQQQRPTKMNKHATIEVASTTRVTKATSLPLSEISYFVSASMTAISLIKG